MNGVFDVQLDRKYLYYLFSGGLFSSDSLNTYCGQSLYKGLVVQSVPAFRILVFYMLKNQKERVTKNLEMKNHTKKNQYNNII